MNGLPNKLLQYWFKSLPCDGIYVAFKPVESVVCVGIPRTNIKTHTAVTVSSCKRREKETYDLGVSVFPHSHIAFENMLTWTISKFRSTKDLLKYIVSMIYRSALAKSDVSSQTQWLVDSLALASLIYGSRGKRVWLHFFSVKKKLRFDDIYMYVCAEERHLSIRIVIQLVNLQCAANTVHSVVTK